MILTKTFVYVFVFSTTKWHLWLQKYKIWTKKTYPDLGSPSAGCCIGISDKSEIFCCCRPEGPASSHAKETFTKVVGSMVLLLGSSSLSSFTGRPVTEIFIQIFIRYFLLCYENFILNYKNKRWIRRTTQTTLQIITEFLRTEKYLTE